MGTRNLTCVVSNGEIKIAQYGQWDGYLDGAGKDIAKFISKDLDVSTFKKKLESITEISEDEYNRRWEEMGADGSGYVDMKTSENFKEKYPFLSRDSGNHILGMIMKDKYTYNKYLPNFSSKEITIDIKVDKVSKYVEFGGESLFCEYAYVLDLDNEVLLIYEGFNKEETEIDNPFKKYAKKDDEYREVKLLTALPFELVDENAIDELIELLNEDEEY